MSNRKEIKFEQRLKSLSHSGKAFNQGGVGILEGFIFSAVTRHVDLFCFVFSLPQMFSLSVFIHSVFWLLRFRKRRAIKPDKSLHLRGCPKGAKYISRI